MIVSVGVAVAKMIVHSPLTPPTVIVIASLLDVVLIVRLLSVKALSSILRAKVALILDLVYILELIVLHVTHPIISLLSILILATIVLLLLLVLPLVTVDERDIVVGFVDILLLWKYSFLGLIFISSDTTFMP